MSEQKPLPASQREIRPFMTRKKAISTLSGLLRMGETAFDVDILDALKLAIAALQREAKTKGELFD